MLREKIEGEVTRVNDEIHSLAQNTGRGAQEHLAMYKVKSRGNRFIRVVQKRNPRWPTK